MAMGKPIKVCLTNQGRDVESAWATDLGPVPGRPGARAVRLANVPFLHAKPTYGDTIEVVPDGRGALIWDREGVAFGAIATRLREDGGRWAMIVDVEPHPDRPASVACEALVEACAHHDVVCELAWPPRGDARGRAYLAVPARLPDTGVLGLLRHAELPCELIQIHPRPFERRWPAPLRRKPTRRVTSVRGPANGASRARAATARPDAVPAAVSVRRR